MYLYVYVYFHLELVLHVCTHAYICSCKCRCICTGICICVCILCIGVCIQICVFECICRNEFSHIYIYYIRPRKKYMHNAHIYIYTCICVHIFICNVLYYIIWLCEQTRLCLNVCVFFSLGCVMYSYMHIYAYTYIHLFAHLQGSVAFVLQNAQQTFEYVLTFTRSQYS